MTTLLQSGRDWLANLRQSKAAPAEKLAEVEQRRRDKTDQLQKVLASSEQAILERELGDLAAEEMALRPAVAAAVEADFERQVKEWDAGEQAHVQKVAASLLVAQGQIDDWEAYSKTRPRPPAGTQDYFSNHNQLFAARKGIVIAGTGINALEEGGTGYAPRLTPKVVSDQVWGVPLGSKGK
jgi:hypothetical protein